MTGSISTITNSIRSTVQFDCGWFVNMLKYTLYN